MNNRLSLRPESTWALNFARKDLKHAGEICDRRKKAHFEANLWRSLDIPVDYEDRCDFEGLLALTQDMEGRLGLFLMPQFLPYLRALDLGESMNPARGEDLRRVEAEYEALRQKMIDTGTIERELSRDESGRTIHVNQLSESAVLGTRNRKLFDFNATGAKVEVHKQTSFIIKPETLISLGKNYGATDPMKVVESIEAAIDSHDPSVYPVRTHFFVKTN